MAMERSCLLFLLFFVLHFTTDAQAQPPATAAPPAGPLNVTAVLQKAGQFTTLIRLLKATRLADQINDQLNRSSSSGGLTLFAPTDNAFSSLSAGTLNSLSDQEKVALLQFHVLPSFTSLMQFQTISNPLRTQAGGADDGGYVLNVTTVGNQVNLTTGVVTTTLSNTIFTDPAQQLVVYQVDKVLLPLAIFGSPSPAPAPALAPAPESEKPKKVPDGAPSADAPNIASARGSAAESSVAVDLRRNAVSGLLSAIGVSLFWWSI